MRKVETILIVDDEPVIRRLLRRTLTDGGYTCLEAGNTAEAGRVLRANAVDLVILDVRMPGQSGLEFLPGLRDSFPDTAVIMATAVDESGAVIQAMKQGAYDYLLKPFNLDEVILSVDRALESRRLKLENREYQLNLEKKVREQTEKIRESYLNTLKALARAVEAKDEYTSDHSRRVAELAVAVATEIKMTPEDISRIRIAGLIHDIGKIGVKETILNKPGKLTTEEFSEVKKHPGIGANILIMVIEDNQILESIVHHHERFDGSGYPDGLCGERIPHGARVLAVADAFDAMTSARPYRTAMDIGTAISEILKNRGTQFDPFIADALVLSLKSVNAWKNKPGK